MANTVGTANAVGGLGNNGFECIEINGAISINNALGGGIMSDRFCGRGLVATICSEFNSNFK